MGMTEMKNRLVCPVAGNTHVYLDKRTSQDTEGADGEKYPGPISHIKVSQGASRGILNRIQLVPPVSLVGFPDPFTD